MLFKKFSLKSIEIDSKIKKTIKIGLYISAVLAVISSMVMFTYLYFSKNLLIYYLGIIILKSSVILTTAFIISGLVVDKIRKDLF